MAACSIAWTASCLPGWRATAWRWRCGDEAAVDPGLLRLDREADAGRGRVAPRRVPRGGAGLAQRRPGLSRAGVALPSGVGGRGGRRPDRLGAGRDAAAARPG